jgi:NADH:ubiquinone oxidoreductase subunit
VDRALPASLDIAGTKWHQRRTRTCPGNVEAGFSEKDMRQRKKPDYRRNSSQRGDATMKTFLLRFFTWWNGQTFGTQVWTKLYGEFVGTDEFGNRYYRTRDGKIDPTLGFERRWVIYNGLVEASKVPPNWHGWLHQMDDVPPPLDTTKPHPWEKPHRPNLTGTPYAHRPSGSTLAQGRRPKATGDYKAWTPG